MTETLLAYRLVRLIETHSEQLTTDLLRKTEASPKTKNYVQKVPPEDLKQAVFEVYRDLGKWLQAKSEPDIARRYTEIGQLRKHQGIELTQLIWVIILVKDNLLDFLRARTQIDQASEVLGEMEVFQLLGQFFDHAVYYAAAGYEHAV